LIPWRGSVDLLAYRSTRGLWGEAQVVLAEVKKGVAKVNIGADIRQSYESALEIREPWKALIPVCQRSLWSYRRETGKIALDKTPLILIIQTVESAK